MDSKDIKNYSIIDSNGHVLEAMVRECGMEIVDRSVIYDVRDI